MSENANKFKTLEELLRAFKRDLPSYAYLDLNDLVQMGIKKKDDGFYHKFQIMDAIEARPLELLTFKRKEKSETQLPTDYWTRREIELYNGDRRMWKDYPIVFLDRIQDFDRTLQIQAYNFSLMLFDKQFQDFVRDTRDIYGLPNTNVKDKGTLYAHFAKRTKEWKKLGLMEGTEAGKMFNVFQASIDMYLLKNTTFYALSNQNQLFYWELLYSYIVFNDPFTSVSEMQGADREFFKKYAEDHLDHAIATPDVLSEFGHCIEVHISIHPETSKEEVHKTIDRVWDVVDDAQKKFPHPPLNQNIRDAKGLSLKWRIYEAYLQGIPYKKIAENFDVSNGNARKIVSEVKKDIHKMKQSQKLLR